MANESDIQLEAKVIVGFLVFTPFSECTPLSRELEAIPIRPGIYAIRHREEGTLYIGKAKHLRNRFKGGHKAFFWSWLDRYDPDDVRILVYPLGHFAKAGLLLELEKLILRATEPPYNVRIAREP